MNNVNVCCLQETEVQADFPESLLSTGGFSLALELNDNKKRAGIYIRNDVKYVRRTDLECKNFHIVICDINTACLVRVICIYRSFRPPGMISPEAFFNAQLSILKNSLTSNCYILGDFNLDASMAYRPDYNYKIPMTSLSNFVSDSNLYQLVSFNTWSRIIKGIKKESMLDHVYVNNVAQVSNVDFCSPVFGDHVLVLIELNLKTPKL